MNLLLTPEGRRAAAFAAVLGGCCVMTVFAAIGVYLVSGNVKYSFWLAIAAHAQILVGLTGLIAMFVKRHIKVGREGVEVSDHAETTTTTTTATAEVTVK